MPSVKLEQKRKKNIDPIIKSSSESIDTEQKITNNTDRDVIKILHEKQINSQVCVYKKPGSFFIDHDGFIFNTYSRCGQGTRIFCL